MAIFEIEILNKNVTFTWKMVNNIILLDNTLELPRIGNPKTVLIIEEKQIWQDKMSENDKGE